MIAWLREFIEQVVGRPGACITLHTTQILPKPGEDRAGREGSRIALGQTASGRYLRVVYVPAPQSDSVFVITAYEMAGKPLAAFRARGRKKQK